MPGNRERIHRRVNRGLGDKAGRAAVPGTMIGKGQVVVNGFGNADNMEFVASMLSGLRQVMGRIRRIVAADIKHVMDVVALQDGENAFRVVLLQFIAAGAKCR